MVEKASTARLPLLPALIHSSKAASSQAIASFAQRGGDPARRVSRCCTTPGRRDRGWAPGANAQRRQPRQGGQPTRDMGRKEQQAEYHERGTKAALLPLNPH